MGGWENTEWALQSSKDDWDRDVNTTTKITVMESTLLTLTPEHGTILAFSEATLAKSLHCIFNNGGLKSLQKQEFNYSFTDLRSYFRTFVSNRVWLWEIVVWQRSYGSFIKQKINRWKMLVCMPININICDIFLFLSPFILHRHKYK